MITIVNYGLGNISAFANAYERLNIPVVIAATADDLQRANKIILPGVGAFDHAMSKLNGSDMRAALEEQVLVHRIPVLGICVGMQMLAKSSDEGILPGLGWIDGTVRRFDVTKLKSKTQLPHMGWNTIQPVNRPRLLAHIDNDSRFYFLHSYYFHCFDSSDMIATSTYGIPFCSAVEHMNIYGVQFHPEKSHQWGIQLLKNFAKM
jgi:glutamine amidotransferase